MSLADDPTITPEAHDLARICALEHLVASLWYVFSVSQSDRLGLSIGDTAAQFRESLKATMVESQMPPEFLALTRAHAAKVLDAAVTSARNADELKPRDPDQVRA